MSHSGRRVLLVALSPMPADPVLQGQPGFPSYGVHLIGAALRADPELAAEVRVVDAAPGDIEALTHAVETFEPDLLGCSAYIWSFPELLRLAQHAKRLNPSCTVIFGGPSATPSMMSLPPYRQAQRYVDALVSGEGEEIIRDLVALPERSAASLRTVAGLYVRSGDGWQATAARPPPSSMDGLASPYQLGMIERPSIVYLEAARGCPCQCLFCSWGRVPPRHRSRERLVGELEVLAALRADATFLVDAGLNLNPRAFANLAAADREVGYLASQGRWTCEVYPAAVRDEHLEFLSRGRHVRVGVGLQTLDHEVLRRHRRPAFKEDLGLFLTKLGGVVRALEIEIILGLPGDSPASFWRTFNTLRDLGCDLRIYRCLILPDALLDHAPDEFAVEFDPETLQLRSCLGWTAETLRQTQDALSERLARGAPGTEGPYWWFFDGTT